MAIFPSTAIPSGAAAGYTIDYSCRFNDDDSAYLSRTPSASDRKTWTLSAWAKLGSTTTLNAIMGTPETGGIGMLRIRFDTEGQICVLSGDGAALSVYSNSKYRDPSAWYHVLVEFDTTITTPSSDRVKIYMNNELVTDFTDDTYPAEDYESAFNAAHAHYIGVGYTSSEHFDGHLAEIHFIDGTALTPTSFGESGDYGEWKPIEYTGSYGNEGFYLDFADSADLGKDVSGNGNDFSNTNLVASDQMLDTPTNNFCVMNPLSPNTTNLTFSEGNLKLAGWDIGFFGTMGVSSGKWYWEMHSTNASGNAFNTSAVGIVHSDALYDTADSSSNDGFQLFGGTNKGRGYYGYAGNKLDASSNVSYGDAFVTGDIIGVALNLEDDEITFYKNNVSQGVAFTSLGSGDWFPLWQNWTSSVGVMNFGQDSSFTGIKTSGSAAASDGNGYGDFYYSPPSDFLALCTSNLDTPAVTPSEHFNTVLYTGNATPRSITGVGFQPDFVWNKTRSASQNHFLYDAVRGASKDLRSNQSGAEGTSDAVTAFGSDGFSVGSGNDGNENTETYVNWNWKANGSGSANTNGDMAETVTVSANADAGFSIVTYTGDGSAATVGHGLSKAPEMIIVKNRTSGNGWRVYHSGNSAAPETDYLVLDSSAATSDDAENWNDTAPTEDIFTIGDGANVNTDDDEYVAYCFHSVDGFSKMGSYEGNGNVDGTFVYTGFRVAWLMVKSSEGSAHWEILDNTRDVDNPAHRSLKANSNDAEDTTNTRNDVDFLSNGFKFREDESNIMNGSEEYIYLAFAKTPFKYSNAR